MTDHDEIKKLLPAYCGGELEPTLRERVERHLNACRTCRETLSDLETTLRLLHTTPEVEPPAWLTSRIMARLRDEAPVRQKWWRRLFLPLHVKLPLEAMALLLVCISGYYLAREVETEMVKPAPPVADMPSPGPPAEKRSTTLPVSPQPRPAPPSPVAQAPAGAPATAHRDATSAEPPPARIAPAQPAPHEAPKASSPAPAPAESPSIFQPPSAEYAPAPPSVKREERLYGAGSGAVGGASRQYESQQPYPSQEKSRSSMSKKAKRAGPTDSEPSAAPAAKAQAPYMLQLKLRLKVSDPGAAAEAVRQAINSSGGSVVGDQPPGERLLKGVIAVDRFDELLERLKRVGQILDRPQPADADRIELVITW